MSRPAQTFTGNVWYFCPLVDAALVARTHCRVGVMTNKRTHRFRTVYDRAVPVLSDDIVLGAAFYHLVEQTKAA